MNGAEYVECGFRWTTSEQPGPHVCRKHPRHVDDCTDDEHRCCCGANTWSYDDDPMVLDSHLRYNDL